MVQQRKHGGFSLVEVVMVLSVMAILMTVATPSILDFINLQREREEENVHREIQKAFEAYVRENGSLPGAVSLTAELSRVSNLSQGQLDTDQWGRPRVYVMHTEQETFLDADVDINYVTVFTTGPDRIVDAGTVGVAVDANQEPDVLTDGDWWHNGVIPVDEYQNVGAAGDDQLTKFTDYQIKIEQYNTTLERMQNLARALDIYAQSRLIEQQINYNQNQPTPPAAPYSVAAAAALDPKSPSILMFYPPSDAPEAADAFYANADGQNYYSPNVLTDMGTYGFSGGRVDNGADDPTRRTEMILLMRLLGLPDSNCCSALHRGSDGEEKAFFYFSNPRPRTGATACGTRPSLAVLDDGGGNAVVDTLDYPVYDVDITLPPRITTDFIANGNNGATCG